MLDQNTDRMWYVIGAVIVGAALIFLMNNTFPTLFANVGETFEGKLEQTTEMTDGIRPPERPTLGYVVPEDVVVKNATLDTYDAKTRTWSLTLPSYSPDSSDQWYVSGLMMKNKSFLFEYGTTHVLTYDVFVPSGTAGMTSVVDVANSPVDPSIGAWEAGRPGDRDDVSNRNFNGIKHPTANTGLVHMPLKSGEWTTLTVTYSNTNKYNTGRHDLYDHSLMGIRNTTGQPMELLIRNVRLTRQ